MTSTLFTGQPWLQVGIKTDDDVLWNNGHPPIAASTEMRIRCKTAAIHRNLIRALQRRERHMSAQPADVQKAIRFTSALTQGDNSGVSVVVVRAIWFDEAYFQQRAGHVLSSLHKRVFAQVGLKPDDVQVLHWRPAVISTPGTATAATIAS